MLGRRGDQWTTLRRNGQRNPFFAVTREDGTFQLPPNLPPGTYTVEAYHLKAGTVSEVLELKAGDKKQLAFRFEL